jgi:ApaG protein
MKNNIEITVETNYLLEESQINKAFVHTYTITLKNKGKLPAKLLSRHWIIADAHKIEEVKGDGVIGQQPTIQPNESYQYNSYCVLKNDLGSMKGTYQMINTDNEYFEAEVPIFYLMAATTIH